MNDAFSRLLGSAGDRGASTSEFTVAVAEDGLYPFVLVWWETGGGQRLSSSPLIGTPALEF
jgi:hypothetical protein